MKVGSNTKDVKIGLQAVKDRKVIVKDGKITDFGKKKFGDLQSFESGVFKIKDVSQQNAGGYSYSLNGNPKMPMMNVVSVFEI
ncbi:unnamed protein product [Gongylonema pulchrum]|uniref:Ig-like_bact domain-containing protein n=1 Tax=Gongylonema pulchrum TaxID=637853 RepID=A0A183D7K5_9BILA|nr:unnamed protein product [Gongylonema pulchrum]